MSTSLQRVRDALAGAGLEVRMERFDAGTRTVAEAAAAIGADAGQIVKSLVFVAPSGVPVLALVSGVNRADEAALAAVLGHPVARPGAQQVRELTGFAVGGVPPLGHATQPATVMDDDLWRHAEIWAGAGTPHDMFATTPADLQRATGATRAAIAAR